MIAVTLLDALIGKKVLVPCQKLPRPLPLSGGGLSRACNAQVLISEMINI